MAIRTTMAQRNMSAATDGVPPRGPGLPLSLLQLLAVAASLALVTAFGELTLLAILKFGLGRTLKLSPSVVWMAPIAQLTLFMVPAAVLMLVSRPIRRLAAPDVVVAVFVFLMMIDLILVERHFNILALLLLSLGIAVQAGRVAAAHRAGFLKLLRVTTPGLVALALLATLLVEGGLAWRRGQVEAALPEASPDSPNVLFIILDTVRARTLSLYGYDRKTTPNLERLGQRGVVFDRAIAPATWTVPSHGSMFTSLWPHELHAFWTSSDAVPPATTIAQFLAQNGYRTAGFIGNWFHIGSESGMGTGFGYYDDIGRSPAQIARGSALIRWLSQRRAVREMIGLYETLGRRRAPDVGGSFLRWLRHDSDRPWFAFLNYMDAHSPYLPPPPFDSRFGTSVSYREPVVIEELNRKVEATPEVVQAETDAYDGGIAYLDDQVGRLFDELERRGELDHTIVIIGADHGEELGEHDRWGHAYSLHSEIVRVPLLIFGPGVPAGLRSEQPASLRNIAATIVDLAGLRDAPFRGVSLSRHWRGRESRSVVDTAFTEFGKFRSLYGGRYHYLVGVFDHVEHLFDHRVDLFEFNDLAGAPGTEAILARFRAATDSISPRTSLDSDAGAPPPADPGN
jgi:arylsulfatase A-like enzyme